MVDGIKEDKDVVAGRDCIRRDMQCTWWGWEEGLRYCFGGVQENLGDPLDMDRTSGK